MNDQEPHMTDVPTDLASHTLVLEPRGAPEEPDEQPVPPLPPEPHNRRDVAVALSAAIAMVGAAVGVGILYPVRVPPPATPALAVAPVPPVPKEPDTPRPYESVSVSARAAVVYDVHAKKLLYMKNGERPLPLASVTKLMTALVAVESTDKDKRIAIDPAAIETEGDSGLFANESWRLRDLISFTMLTSSNDGADAIAASVGGLFQSTPSTTPSYERVDSFVEKMNTRAQELGLKTLTFNNPTGLDEGSGREGGVGSAEDVSKLLAYIWQNAPDALGATDERSVRYVSEDGFIHQGENTNENVYTTPGILGSKTGYTDLAGGNLAIIYDAGMDHPVAVVVLGSTREARFDDVKKLVDATYRYMESGWYAYDVAGSTPQSS